MRYASVVLALAVAATVVLSPKTVAAQCTGYSGPGGPCYSGPGGGSIQVRVAASIRVRVVGFIAVRAEDSTVVPEAACTQDRVVGSIRVPEVACIPGPAVEFTQGHPIPTIPVRTKVHGAHVLPGF